MSLHLHAVEECTNHSSYGEMDSREAVSSTICEHNGDSLNYLEDTMLHIKERFMPLRSTNTMSSDANTTDEGGRPAAEVGEVSDDGEITQERGEGW